MRGEMRGDGGAVNVSTHAKVPIKIFVRGGGKALAIRINPDMTVDARRWKDGKEEVLNGFSLIDIEFDRGYS